MKKIARSVCYFTRTPGSRAEERIAAIRDALAGAGYAVQTRRICAPGVPIKKLSGVFGDDVLKSPGTLTAVTARRQLDDFFESNNVSFNIDLSGGVRDADIRILFTIIRNRPGKTFNFAYVFNNAPSSPFFPSATYEKTGFSIGLQPTDLSAGCTTLDEWLARLKSAWNELYRLFGKEKDFLGIDSSAAPLFHGESSLVNFVKRLGMDFSSSATTDFYLRISAFLKAYNPKPIGLCGIMFPCLEDFELAEEYGKGNFSIERNLFLSLHSGLGIDTYPIGVDETPARVKEILSLVHGLATKHSKPLSVRFVSDGTARAGMKTAFRNQYLKDVVVRRL